MGDIETIYEDLDTDGVSLEEFREAVEAKLAETDGERDERTAAETVAQELAEEAVDRVADVTPEQDEVTVIGTVVRTEGDMSDGQEDRSEEPSRRFDLADETGLVRVAVDAEVTSALTDALETGRTVEVTGEPATAELGTEIIARAIGPADTERRPFGTVLETTTVDDPDENEFIDGASVGNVFETIFDAYQETSGAVEYVPFVEIVLDQYERTDMGTTLADAVEDVATFLETYQDTGTEKVSFEEFYEAIKAKVEQMGGLADDETAAMLLAHELDDGQVEGVADIEPGMEEVTFTAKVTSVGELRTFERDDPDQPEGQVLNADVADETGEVRVSFWDEQASSAAEDLESGTILKLKGRPKDGYDGVEVAVDDIKFEPGVEIDVDLTDEYRVTDLTLGASDVTLVGEVLATDPVRTFERDDGSEGKVSNVLVGDETGRVRVTLWDEKAERAEAFAPHDTVEIMDGYVRERDGSLELHVGNRGSITEQDAEVSYDPEAKPINAVELDETADIAGVVRSADPKRTFDREDGSEGQVRNVRIQDDSDDIRVALWGDKADLEIGPGDEVLFVDVAIQDGWQDELEASANWQSTIVPLESGLERDIEAEGSETDTGLAAFGAEKSKGADTETATKESERGKPSGESDDAAAPEAETVEFTGRVVQAGNPVILDDGERTVTIHSEVDVELGEELTVAGELSDGILEPDRIE